MKTDRLRTKLAAFVRGKGLSKSNIKYIKADTEAWYTASATDEQIDELIEFAYKTATADFVCRSIEYRRK